MYNVFCWIFKKINIKVNSIELFDLVKYIIKFFYISVWTMFIFLAFYYSIYYAYPNIYWINSVFKVVLLIQLYFKYSNLLMQVRKLSPNNSSNIKVIYKCFILVMLLSIALSYCKDDFVHACKNVLNIPIPIMTGHTLVLKDVLSKAYDFLLVAKTSLEIVIVKDAIFQMNNWHIQKTVIEYWEELINAGKIYILSEDKNKEEPRLWYIRGEACGDLVDYLDEYHIKKSNKFIIDFTKAEQEEIINTRKKKNLYDENDILDSDNPAINIFDFSRFKKDFKPEKHVYYIRAQLIDCSYFDKNFIKKELINNYRNKFLIFPPSVKAISSKKSKILVMLNELIRVT